MKPRPGQKKLNPDRQAYDPDQRSKYWQKQNSPPGDTNWLWLTRDMLSSPAFRQLSGNALLIVMRVAVEHLCSGGKENGRLVVTHRDFITYGVSAKAVATSIREAEALGWITVTERGRGGKAGDYRRPNCFALSWLPTAEGNASNAWRRFTSADEARRAVADVRTLRVAPPRHGDRLELPRKRVAKI
ncbi:hypothetical protein LMIY3S_01805 [Labrys miyagiensis]